MELAGNPLLAGRQPNREGRTLSLTASWLFRRRHHSGYLNWEAIALGEFNRAGNQAEPLERRVAWAVRDWRDCREPNEQFPAYLARSRGYVGPYVIRPHEFRLAALLVENLPPVPPPAAFVPGT